MVLREEPVADLGDEVRDVDDGQRVRAFEHQDAADRNRAQSLLGPQYRLRAIQATQIESCFIGWRSWHCRSRQHWINQLTTA